MIKDFLKRLDTPITEMLPSGGIQQLADEFNLHRLSVTNMLKGQYGNEDKVAALFHRAMEIIQSQATDSAEYVRECRERLSSELLEKSSV